MSEKQEENSSSPAFEEARAAILREALSLAAFDGWTGRMFEAAADAAAVDPATAAAAFPGGVRDVIRYWSRTTDDAMAQAMAAPGFAEQRIRDRVAGAVSARLDLLRPHRESARRAAAYLAAPPFAPLGARLTWASADAIWRALGDRSTDFNFYTKRAILSGVLTATLARWFADDSEDETATAAFLAARIDNVMQIEKVKAQAKKVGFDPAAPVGWLARLRYPAGR